MAATVNITSYHGATGSTTNNVDGGNLRFKVADNDTADALNPVPIPAAGTNYSYLKQLRFNAGTTPSNTIDNLKFYTDGANGFGTGVGLAVKAVTEETGTATSGTTTTLTDTGASWTTDQFQHYVLEITAGTGSGQARTVTSNTATVITVGSAFGVALDNTSVYRLVYVDPTAFLVTQLTGASDAFGYTSGSALTVAGSIDNPSTGAFGDHMQLQVSVASTASPGTSPNETLTFSYDES